MIAVLSTLLLVAGAHCSDVAKTSQIAFGTPDQHRATWSISCPPR
ncbi:MAG: hypothetical protein ACRDTG_27190 [Pseudonocardiaceae bacterium]